MKTLNLIILVLLPIFFSCKSEQKEKEKHIAQLVNEWQGKQIVFPENSIFTRYLTDTTDYQIPQSEYKVLIYVDSIGCTSCKLQLHKWKELIEYTDSVTQNKVPFLFFFHPKDAKEIRYLLKRDGLDRPICIDLDDRLNKLNKFPADITFQTFLLDQNNKVAILGNPVHNTAVKELYLKQITGTQSNAVLPKTRIETEQSEYDLGTIKTGTAKKQTVTVRNSGTTVFKLKGFTTSCDCTEAACDWKELQPGESGTITVSYKAEKPGDFYQTVEIYENIPNNSLILSFIGTVK